MLARPRRLVVQWVGCPVILPDGAGQLMSFTDVTDVTDEHGGI